MNKKGIEPITISIILIVLALVLLSGGIIGNLAASKFSDIFTSPIAIIVLFFLVLFLISGRKK